MSTEVSKKIDTEQIPYKKNKDFKLLALSSLFSLFGDQLTLLTLPWLVLSLTSDPLVLGSMIGTLAIPMSLFILIGGVLVDKFSPKAILLSAKFSGILIVSGIALLVHHQLLTIPILYFLIFLLGTATAFAAPAATSLLPKILKKEELQPANAVLMIVRSFAALSGPLLAAFILSTNSNENNVVANDTLTLAFGLNGAGLIISFLFMTGVLAPPSRKDKNSTVLNDLSIAFIYFWQKKQLKLVVLYAGLTSLFVSGPIHVALPLLVQEQFQSGPGVFGIIMAASAFGGMIGMTLAVKLPQLGKLTFGMTLLLVDIISGISLSVFSFLDDVLFAVLVILFLQIFTGYVQVALVTWIQLQSNTEMLGRMMSIVMFTIIGLTPLSAAMSGFLLTFIAADMLFLIAGIILSSIAILAILFTNIGRITKVQADLTPKTVTLTTENVKNA